MRGLRMDVYYPTQTENDAPLPAVVYVHGGAHHQGGRFLPAMSVPLGMSSDGLPVGSYLVARAGDGKTLFELAYEPEQAQPWAGKWAPNSAKA